MCFNKKKNCEKHFEWLANHVHILVHRWYVLQFNIKCQKKNKIHHPTSCTKYTYTSQWPMAVIPLHLLFIHIYIKWKITDFTRERRRMYITKRQESININSVYTHICVYIRYKYTAHIENQYRAIFYYFILFSNM